MRHGRMFKKRLQTSSHFYPYPSKPQKQRGLDMNQQPSSSYGVELKRAPFFTVSDKSSGRWVIRVYNQQDQLVLTLKACPKLRRIIPL